MWPPGLLPVLGHDLTDDRSPGRLLPYKQVRGDCSQAFARGPRPTAPFPCLRVLLPRVPTAQCPSPGHRSHMAGSFIQ